MKMNSKRQLYKPAPKQVVGQKKVRKLVQGRLESSPFAGIDNTQQSQTSHLNMSSSTNFSTDTREDLALTPRRAVPSVTEQISPRAEPLSRCLDLSDTEINLSAASSGSTARQPIMVCDASHLASSSDNTEVEVLVNYEDSPAKVICHTPRGLEKSLRSSLAQSSPRSVSSRNDPRIVVVDSPRTLNSSRSLFPGSSKGKIREEKSTTDLLISDHSRGIIKEILAEEIGDSIDISSISLTSQQLSISNLPRSSSPFEISKHSLNSSFGKPSINSSSSGDPNKSSHQMKRTPILTTYPKLNLNEDSDYDERSNCNSNNTKKDRIDRTPKVQAAKALALKDSQNDSDSETCSLYEYVLQKKVNVKKKSEVVEKGNKSQATPEVIKKPRSAKKKPGRVVASRYMNAAASNSGNQSSLGSARDSVVSDSSYTRPGNVSKTTGTTNARIKPSMMPTKPSLKPARSTNKLLSVAGGKSSASISSSAALVASQKGSATNIRGKKDDKDRLTSTPTRDESYYPQEIDASSISVIQSSTLAILGNNNSPDPDITLKKNAPAAAKKSTKVLADKRTLEQQQLHLDLQHTRYLQALFIATKVKKSFREQEKQATKQLSGLWTLREKNKAELVKSKLEVERLKNFLQTDHALDKTETQLQLLEEKLPQVTQDYSKLCSALNDTRHQIGTTDIYIPNKTEDEREAYEERLESTLKESEGLLNQIGARVGSIFPPLHQYVASLQAISNNVAESGNELCEGHKNLEVAQGLCSQLSSHMVLGMQNSSARPVE